MKCHCLTLFAFLYTATPLTAQAPARDTLGLRPLFRVIDNLAARTMQAANTPGLALALVDRTGVITVRSYGYADLERRLPVTPATRWQIGSISKSFTAIALMQLKGEGRFDPQRPVQSYLPWFTPKSRWRPVTGHDLLTHTSGLPRDRDDIPSSPAQGYLARERTLGSAPGTKWVYSNIGFQVLGQLLESLARKPYSEVIRQRIVEPLGMTATEVGFTHATRLNLARGYRPLYDDRPSRSSDALVPAEWVEYGSGDGSIVANPADLGAYLIMLLNRGKGPDGEVLSGDGFTMLMTAYAKTSRGSDVSYGYGMFVGKLGTYDAFWHSGGMLGYSTYLIGIPSLGIGAVAFVNGPGEPGTIARYATRALASVIQNEPLPDPPESPDPTHVEHPEQYAGSFVSPTGDSLTFEASGDSLLLVHATRRTALETFEDDAFLGPAPEFALYPIRFGRDSTGITEAWYGEQWYAGARYRGPRTFATPAEWRGFTGHYRIMQPWEPTFRIAIRKGKLWWIGPEGEEDPLTAIGPREFRAGELGSAERLRFDNIVGGRALSATYSGMTYYRFFTP